MEDTKEIVANNKRFHLETDIDQGGTISAIRLTQCDKTGKAEILETYDFTIEYNQMTVLLKQLDDELGNECSEEIKKVFGSAFIDTRMNQ